MKELCDWRVGLRDEVLHMELDGFKMPDAITNANPLNVVSSDRIIWRGQIGQDPGGYLRFLDASYGIRAAAIMLGFMSDLGGAVTVRQLVGTWGKRSPLTVDHYVTYVAGVIGIQPDERYDRDVHGRIIVRAMIGYECGKLHQGRRVTEYYNMPFIRDAVGASHRI